MKREKMIINQSGISIRTLFRNKDDTYTVYIERINPHDMTIEFSYEMNFGLFGEALNCVNYIDNKKN
jgi:hypothetical protein